MPLAPEYQKPKHKKRYYYQNLGDFREELRNAVPRDELRELHKAVWWKHALIVIRQFALWAIAIYVSLQTNNPLIWIPCAFVIGFIVFDFTVLLHEVLHGAVFAKQRPFLSKLLGFLYAVPSGISRSQFTRWHLDHHDELGNWDDDPKRHHLTPKINKRWYKLLYMTPVLFPIYFRAAAKECATYPVELQKQIAFERKITIGTHLLTMILLIIFAGWMTFLKIYAIPYFFVFPIAFTINRLGQHYSINPKDVASWTTLMKGSWFWDRVYLFSNYHLEHHYFPGVPCYNLPKLQKTLQPLFDRHQMEPQTYGKVLWGWFVLNKPPHTDWDIEAEAKSTAPAHSTASTP